jgi:acetyltransferase-like isoleucine patch superfamily enzyme
MSLGKYTYGCPNCIQWAQYSDAKFSAGKFCSIGGGLTIYLGGNHNTSWISLYPFGTVNVDKFNTVNVNNLGHPFTNGDVVIGNDVWIGDNVTIMSGVKIGNGSVVAANSHVVKNVEPYSIVGGNPAKLIRYRFEKEQIEKLERIKWWDWPDEKINQNLRVLCSPNIEDLIDEHYEPHTDDMKPPEAKP